MKAVLAAVAAVGVVADYAADGDFKKRSPIIKADETMCFGVKDASGTHDNWDKDCNLKQVAGGPHENTTFYTVSDTCIVQYSSASGKGGLGMDFGKLDDACCQAMNTMFVVGAGSYYGQHTGGWSGTFCHVDGGNCAAIGDKTTYPYHHKDAVNTFSWYTGNDADNAHTSATMPDEAAFNKHSLAAFGNDATCYNKAMGHAGANPARGGNALMGFLFGLYGNVRKGSDFRMVAKRGNAIVNPANGPMCLKAKSIYGTEQSCSLALEDGDVKVTAPNCVYRSFVDATSGQVLFIYGDKAATEPGCCEAMITLTVVANARAYEDQIVKGESQGAHSGCDSYVDSNYMFMGALPMPQPQPSCMSEGGNSTKPYWSMKSDVAAKDGVYMHPVSLASSTRFFPSEAAFDQAAKKVAGANKDGACLANVMAYTTANPKIGNAVVGGALSLIPPMIAAYTTTTTTTTTTIRAAPAETAAPTTGATKQVEASFTATEDLPASITGAQLLASTAYKTAKQTGIAKSLGLSTSDVTITGFEVSRRQLLANKRSLASKSVVTKFTVKAADDSVATTLKNSLKATDFGLVLQTEMNKAFAATDFSSDAVISSAPSATVANVAAPVTADAPAPAPASSAAAVSAFGAIAISLALF